MKELVAFLFLIVLLGFGWNQPYKAHFSSLAGNPPPVPPAALAPAPEAAASAAAAPAVATPAPARDSSWLWKKTSMDGPQSGEGGKGGGKHGR